MKRERHHWAPGYFDGLIGERIPFRGARGEPLTGILESVQETAELIVLEFRGPFEPE